MLLDSIFLYQNKKGQYLQNINTDLSYLLD